MEDTVDLFASFDLDFLHMDKLKTILTLIAVIMGILLVLSVIGLIYTAINYLLLIGLVAVIAFGVFKYRTRQTSLDKSDGHPELRQANRTLEEYKRRLK
jgi:hypothetical protein